MKFFETMHQLLGKQLSEEDKSEQGKKKVFEKVEQMKQKETAKSKLEEFKEKVEALRTTRN